MSNKEKRELAEWLYTNGIESNQKNLSIRVKVSEVTISNWKKKYKWEEHRKSLLTTRQQELRNLYDQLAELNQHIKDREEGVRFATSKEADALTKITAAIRNLEIELSIAQVTDVFVKFNEYVVKLDMDKAKELGEMMDSYIKTLL